MVVVVGLSVCAVIDNANVHNSLAIFPFTQLERVRARRPALVSYAGTQMRFAHMHPCVDARLNKKLPVIRLIVVDEFVTA